MPFLFEHGDVKTVGQLGMKAGQAQADVAQKQKDFQREMQERQFQQQEEMLEIQRNADKQALQASQDWEIQKASIYSQAQVAQQLAAEDAEFQHFLQRQISKQQELDSKLDALDRLADEGSVDPKLIAMKKADLITGMRSSMGGGGNQTMADMLAGLKGEPQNGQMFGNLQEMSPKPTMVVDGVEYQMDSQGQLVRIGFSPVADSLERQDGQIVTPELEKAASGPAYVEEGWGWFKKTVPNVPVMQAALTKALDDPRLTSEEKDELRNIMAVGSPADIENAYITIKNLGQESMVPDESPEQVKEVIQNTIFENARTKEIVASRMSQVEQLKQEKTAAIQAHREKAKAQRESKIKEVENRVERERSKALSKVRGTNPEDILNKINDINKKYDEKKAKDVSLWKFFHSPGIDREELLYIPAKYDTQIQKHLKEIEKLTR